MSPQVSYRRIAKKELTEAAEWYDRQRPGLGRLFVVAVRDLVEQIKLQPTAHAVVTGDVRQAIVPKYPYIVLYRLQKRRIAIIAVVHSSRDPAVWQSRV